MSQYTVSPASNNPLRGPKQSEQISTCVKLMKNMKTNDMFAKNGRLQKEGAETTSPKEQ